jgi:putative integral membrane protein (TIGR02587 family)
LSVAAVIVLVFNAFNGFRRDSSVLEVVIDSVEAMGIGVVVALIALVLLGRIESGTALRDAAGQVALEAIPIAFGASLARAQLGGGDDGEGAAFGIPERLLVAAGGALLFSLNVAPTEEPVMIGLEASPAALLGVIVASLAVTLAIAFIAEFGGRRHRATGLLDRPWAETLVAYAISLAVAWLLLWSFGRVDGAGTRAIVGMTVSLGLVAALGAAVGRVLVTGHAAEEE